MYTHSEIQTHTCLYLSFPSPLYFFRLFLFHEQSLLSILSRGYNNETVCDISKWYFVTHYSMLNRLPVIFFFRSVVPQDAIYPVYNDLFARAVYSVILTMLIRGAYWYLKKIPKIMKKFDFVLVGIMSAPILNLNLYGVYSCKQDKYILYHLKFCKKKKILK